MRRLAPVIVAFSLMLSACGGAHQAISVSVSHHTAKPAPGETLVAATSASESGARRYGYAWERCNRSGRDCRKVTGATLTFYALSRADIGHTIRVVVSLHGTGSAESSASPVVSGTGRTRDCFTQPGACGFPDPTTGGVGVPNCSALPSWQPSDLPSIDYRLSGSTIDITAANVTIQGYSIGDWSFYVTGKNFTLNDDCVSYDGGDTLASTAVWSTTSGMTVETSTIIAPGCAASPTAVCNSDKVDEALVSGGTNTTVNDDVLAGAVEPLNGLGPGSLIANSYIVANGLMNGAHSEAVYEAQTQHVTIIHNTLLNPFDQSGVVFLDTLGHPCENQFTITDNLMGGGGYILYECSSGTAIGTSHLIFTNNDIARCGRLDLRSGPRRLLLRRDAPVPDQRDRDRLRPGSPWLLAERRLLRLDRQHLLSGADGQRHLVRKCVG